MDDPLLPSAIHATRLDYSEFDAPEAVTVITQEDIRLAGYLEVSEIFRSVPGFRIVKIGDESRVSYHGTTVIQNRRMRVTIDGRSVLIGNGQYIEFDRLPIDLEDIARVTITRGPNGAAWGDNAFLASVDFTTTVRDAPPGITLRAGGGSNDRRKYGLSVHEQFAGYDLAFSTGIEHDGGYDYLDSNKTPRDDGKDIRRARLTLEQASTQASRWRLDASAYNTDNKSGIPKLRLSGDQDNKGEFIALSHEMEIGESSRIDWFVSHDRQRERLRQFACYTPETIAGVLDVFTDPALRDGLLAPTLFVPRLLGVRLSDTCFFTDLGIDSNRTELEIEYESRTGPVRYLAGGSATRVDASSKQWFASMDQTQRSYRAFGETAMSLGQLHSSVGLMVQDSSNVEDVEWAWRAALNWQFKRNQMLRYSYTKSFRIPSLVESKTYWTSRYFFGRRSDSLSDYRFSLSSPVTTNSTIVMPEIIKSHAIGYFGSFLQSRVSVDVKAYNEGISDPVEASLIHFSPPPFNSRSFSLNGVEVEMTFRVTDRWRLTGQYSYLDTDAESPSERALHGDHGASVSAGYRFSPRHAFALGYYGNSAISGNSYDRYDLVYTYDRPIGSSTLRSQLVLQHHIGGVDGVRGDIPFSSNEGYFAHLNQMFYSVEWTF